MDKADKTSVTNETEGGSDTREPYEAPRMEVESLFEVVALSCGKTSPPPTNACLRVNRVS